MDNNLQIYFNALQAMVPELFVVAAILFACLWNLFNPQNKGATPAFAVCMLVVASWVLLQQMMGNSMALFPPGLFLVDKLTDLVGIVACGVGILTILMTMGYEYHLGSNAGEYYAILLTAVLAVMILAGTTDLVLLFVGLETLTICCVLLAGALKSDRKSNEASLKYLLSTAATTATFLYGLSFLYGITGSTNYMEILPKIAVANHSPSLILVFLLVLLLSVVGFKLSMVPFHMWTPDVYEGAPTPVSAFLSVGSKLGGFVVAIRLITVLFSSSVVQWQPILAVLAILCMIAGNFIALSQSSLKRMLAYSSIAHVGYLLIGLAANSADGLTAMLFYLIVYGFMNLGAFTGAILFENETGTDNIEEMSGLIRKRPWLAVGLGVCLLNLAGLPLPPAGFLAKAFIFFAGFQMYSSLGNCLVIAALITSVPAVYYYTRVAIMMVVRDPSESVSAMTERRPLLPSAQGPTVFALVISVLGIIAATFWVNPLMTVSAAAVHDITRTPAIGSLPATLH